MIVTENIMIDGRDFTHTFSDKHFYIERDGVRYVEAYDPAGSGRTYTETDIPIEHDEEAYAEAGKILMGVIE